jgi:hypothetical protein
VARTPTELDAVWTACAAAIDLPVARGGEAFVHFDGRVLWVADDADLDDDDSLAQLVFHELCHLAVQGPAMRHVPDWGLDSSSDRDLVREHGAVRLQAHLAGLWGLRAVLFPTTEVRALWNTLPDDALGPASDESSACARVGTARIAREPFSPAIAAALEATARWIGAPKHRSGWPRVAATDGRTCGTCAWRTNGGWCRHGRHRVRVGPDDAACTRHERALDCLACGACCRSGFDVVPLGPREAARLDRWAVRSPGGGFEMRRSAGRSDDRCAALLGEPAGPYTCAAYAERPRACRDLDPGGRHCLAARRRVGLSA